MEQQIMLSEIGQTEKNKYFIFFLMQNLDLPKSNTM
jgi:hypothetical protein